MNPSSWKLVVAAVLSALAIVAPVLALTLHGFSGPPPYLFLAERLEGNWAAAKNFPDGSRVTVHGYADDAAARLGVDALLQAIIPRKTTTKILGQARYVREDGRQGLLLPVGPVVVHIEAGDRQTINARLEALPFIAANPRQNVVGSLLVRHTGLFFLGLVVYTALWLYGMTRLGMWAARIPPTPGTVPVSAEVLRERLLAMNALNLPFAVRETSSGRLVAQWRFADVHWVGLMHAGGVEAAHEIHLRIDPGKREVKAFDRQRRIEWQDGVAKLSASWSFFQGIVFFQYARETQAGAFFDNGRWTLRSYDYRFDAGEMKAPIVGAITGSGWAFRPVVAFFGRGG